MSTQFFLGSLKPGSLMSPSQLPFKQGDQTYYRKFACLFKSEIYQDRHKKMGWIMGIIAFVLLFTSVMNYLLIIVGNLVGRSRSQHI